MNLRIVSAARVQRIRQLKAGSVTGALRSGTICKAPSKFPTLICGRFAKMTNERANRERAVEVKQGNEQLFSFDPVVMFFVKKIQNESGGNENGKSEDQR